MDFYQNQPSPFSIITKKPIKATLQEIKQIKDEYDNFGGVFVWEYFNSPPDPTNPYKWSFFKVYCK